MKFGICNDVYRDWKITDSITHAAGLGYQGIELAPFTLTDDVARWPISGQKDVAQCASDHGVEILGLHWLLVTPEGLHVSAPDEKVRSTTRDFFKKLIEIAVNTGGKVLTLGSPQQRNFSPPDTHADAVARMAEFFRGLSPELEASGVVVGLEPLEPDVTNVMTRTNETMEIVGAIGSPNVGVTLDTHFLRWEDETHGVSCRAAFDAVGGSLTHCHIQDDNSAAPGTGGADFSDYVQEIRRIDWKGWISLETFPRDDLPPPDTIAEATMRFFQRTLG